MTFPPVFFPFQSDEGSSRSNAQVSDFPRSSIVAFELELTSTLSLLLLAGTTASTSPSRSSKRLVTKVSWSDVAVLPARVADDLVAFSFSIPSPGYLGPEDSLARHNRALSRARPPLHHYESLRALMGNPSGRIKQVVDGRSSEMGVWLEGSGGSTGSPSPEATNGPLPSARQEGTTLVVDNLVSITFSLQVIKIMLDSRLTRRTSSFSSTVPDRLPNLGRPHSHLHLVRCSPRPSALPLDVEFQAQRRRRRLPAQVRSGEGEGSSPRSGLLGSRGEFTLPSLLKVPKLSC